MVEISADAAAFIRQRGGRVWVWAARPRVCCAGTPAWMHAATDPPPGPCGFAAVPAAGVQLFFRGLAGRQPGTLEIALRGRRRPVVEAYWDGCLMAMG